MSDLQQALLNAGVSPGMIALFIVVIIILIIWSSVWKGVALWKAARKNSLVWFIVLLVVNTLGILEILYIFVFSKLKQKKRK